MRVTPVCEALRYRELNPLAWRSAIQPQAQR